MGQLLHGIFRNMITINDFQKQLNSIVLDGKLPEAEREHVKKMIFHALSNPIVSKWFAPDAHVKTEAEILMPDGTIARPDRIVIENEQVQVIDYKFGKQIVDNHRQQVLNYMNILSNMGYSSIKGYLWYVTLNEVMEIL